MRSHPMNEKPRPAAGRAESLTVAGVCAAASLAAIGWSWRQGAMLNYGDAVAHLHIARRILDSRRPGLEQLGSVWLPLPHLLMLPFVQVYAWWADGIAGTIPSALAFLAACAGIYRLARRWMGPVEAALALAFFALNANLLYLQTTAMTEPLFVCETIWIVVGLVEWHASQGPRSAGPGLRSASPDSRSASPGPRSASPDSRRTSRLQVWIAVALVAAIWTRYDGWVMALVAWTGMGLVLLRRGRLRSRSFWLATAVVIAAPLAWFAYNAVAFGDWLEFVRGPYSAHAIELHTAAHGAGPLHPGWHNPWVGLLFFLKVAEMDAAPAAWGNVVLTLSVLGTAWGVLGCAWGKAGTTWESMTARRGAFGWALLLWLPVPFYAYSVAYGSVPIFLPAWWPHSWYNTRYGVELLPALALGVGFAAAWVLAMVRELRPSWVRYAAGFLIAIAALNAWALVREGPLVYVESTKNLAARKSFDVEIPPRLRELAAERPGGAVLMNTSVYPELVALSGMPLRRTINESDKEFYWDALAAPAAHAAVVLAFDGDEIDRAVKAHPNGLRAVGRFTAKGQPGATMYVSELWPGS